jgi:hypothetical protein
MLKVGEFVRKAKQVNALEKEGVEGEHDLNS